VTELPEPVTPEGQAGLAAILAEPSQALIALDFDGTLSPIVSRPEEARAHPAAGAALRRVAPLVGTLAVITGRPAADAAELGGFAKVPGLIVLGHYGLERWADGKLDSPAAEPGVAAARAGPSTSITRWPCIPARRPTRRPRWTGSARRSPSWPPGTG
jgi:trehalose 6-phosphate phosphatase